MKKMKSMLLFSLLAMPPLFAGCNDDKSKMPEPAPQLTFTLEVGDPGVSSVNMGVKPSDKESLYYYDLLAKSILDTYHEGSLDRYMENLLAEVLTEYGTPEAALQRLASKGDQSYLFEQLNPNTTYVAFAVGLDQSCALSTEFTSQEVTTLPLPEICTWEVTFDQLYYDGATFTITPSDDQVYYYFTVRPSASYGSVMEDAELLETILMEDSFMIDFYAVSGEYQSLYEMQEFICCADTGYDLLLFGYADGQPLTSIKRYPFRTLASESPASECQFDIQVTEPSAHGAKVVVNPSDPHQMYLWDVVLEEELQADYANNIETYVEAYVENLVQTMGLYEIDFSRVMGEDSYQFSNEFEADKGYVVWAVCVDEFAELAGAISTTSFSTLTE